MLRPIADGRQIAMNLLPLLQAMERFIEKSVMRDKRIEELKEIIPMKQKKRR
jgi:hypothetical protein